MIFGTPWQNRRIVLNQDDCTLKYYDGKIYKDTVTLNGMIARHVPPSMINNRKNTFCVYDADNEEVVMLTAATNDDMNEWIEAINHVAGKY